MPDNARMQLTLDTLRADVERTPLSDSMAVRRRGDQRTRRQAVGASLAAVVLVLAVGGLASSLLGGTDRAQAPIATNPPTVSPSSDDPSSSPTVSSASTVRTEVPNGALLDARALNDLQGLQNEISEATDAGAGIETLNPCLLSSRNFVGSNHVVFTARAGPDLVASEFVITQNTVEAARKQLDGYGHDLEVCSGPPAGGGGARTVSPINLTPAQAGALGDGAWAFSVSQPGGAFDGGDLSAYVLGVRAGNALAVVAFDADTFGARTFGNTHQAIAAAITARDRLATTFTPRSSG